MSAPSAPLRDARPGANAGPPKLFEHGRGVAAPPHNIRWIYLGPVVLELHRWWLRLGVCVGRWYVGFYLGPVVITFGSRQWRWRPSYLVEVTLADLMSDARASEPEARRA